MIRILRLAGLLAISATALWPDASLPKRPAVCLLAVLVACVLSMLPIDRLERTLAITSLLLWILLAAPQGSQYANNSGLISERSMFLALVASFIALTAGRDLSLRLLAPTIVAASAMAAAFEPFSDTLRLTYNPPIPFQLAIVAIPSLLGYFLSGTNESWGTKLACVFGPVLVVLSGWILVLPILKSRDDYFSRLAEILVPEIAVPCSVSAVLIVGLSQLDRKDPSQ